MLRVKLLGGFGLLCLSPSILSDVMHVRLWSHFVIFGNVLSIDQVTGTRRHERQRIFALK